MNKTIKRNLLIILSGLLVMLIVGSFYDYTISSSLYDPHSYLGIILASYGQLPAMLFLAIAAIILLKLIEKGKILKNILCCFFCGIFQFFSLIGITVDPMLYMQDMPLWLSFSIALILVLSCDIIVFKLTHNIEKTEFLRYVVVIMSVVLLEIIVINIIKIPWARPRMRLLASCQQATFQPWWTIGCSMKETLINAGIKAEEFKSFPSGHAGNASCALLLMTLPYIFPQLKGKENLLCVIGIVFTIIVSYSRIVMGAHFLSDVCIGSIVTIVLIFIFLSLLKNKNDIL